MAEGDAENITHGNKQRTQAPRTHSSSEVLQESYPIRKTAFILLNLRKKKKKALEPISWNQRLLNTRIKKKREKNEGTKWQSEKSRLI